MNRTHMYILIAGAPAFAVIAAVYVVVGAGAATLPEGWGADRMRLAAGASVAIGFTLTWAILDVSLHRLFSPADIAGAGLTEPTPALKLKRAILQNTTEQALLASIAYFGLAAFAPPHWLALIPALAGLFVLGRVLFRFGYRFGAPGRAPGIALTFAPTILAYALLLGFLLAPG